MTQIADWLRLIGLEQHAQRFTILVESFIRRAKEALDGKGVLDCASRCKKRRRYEADTPPAVMRSTRNSADATWCAQQNAKSLKVLPALATSSLNFPIMPPRSRAIARPNTKQTSKCGRRTRSPILSSWRDTMARSRSCARRRIFLRAVAGYSRSKLTIKAYSLG